MEIAKLTPAFGAIVEGDGSDPLLEVPTEDVIRLFRNSGAVLLRGFHLSGDAFERFTERFGTDFLINGNTTRETVSEDGKTQTVNPGSGLIPPHAEMAYSPFRPDILWFHCVQPAERGGATVLCDGSSLWSRMKPATRAPFSNSRVRYIFRNLPEQWLAAFTGRPASARAMLSTIPDLDFEINEDGSLNLEYKVSAVVTAKYAGVPAFANSVLVEDKSAHFEDGTPIPRALRLELFSLACDAAHYVKWRAGDILMVDNSRLMHGREPFADASRQIHVRLCRKAGF